MLDSIFFILKPSESGERKHSPFLIFFFVQKKDKVILSLLVDQFLNWNTNSLRTMYLKCDWLTNLSFSQSIQYICDFICSGLVNQL